MTPPPDVDPPTERMARVPAPGRQPRPQHPTNVPVKLAAPPAKRPARALIVLGGIAIVGLVLVWAMGGGTSSTNTAAHQPGYTQVPQPARPPEVPTAGAVGTAPAAAPTSAAPTAGTNCTKANAAAKREIEASLTDSDYSLGTTYVVRADGLTYYGAHIERTDGVRVSSADVWVTDGTRLAALSGGARDNSALPDGRRLYGVSAGDDPGVQVQDCTISR